MRFKVQISEGENGWFVVDLLLSSKLRKIKRSVTLDEVTSWIGEHVVEDADATAIIREMRDKKYDY
jgi:hypothetical protein